MNQIYSNNLDSVNVLSCFGGEFRASIPIFKKSKVFYTTYNFNRNRIIAKDTVFVSVKGNNKNNGKTPVCPKKTIEAALITNARTIILLEGRYCADTHFQNGTKLSERNLIGKGKVVLDNMQKQPLVISGNAFVCNIEFVNGNRGSLRAYIDKPNKICTYINCKFNNSLVDDVDVGKALSLGGLRVQGGTHFLYRCEASNNGFDGFSYHAAPDGSSNSPHVVEVECRAFHNGEHNSYESDNASTAHDGAHILRLNCVYGYSHGGNVADVHKNTVSLNIGCVAYSVMNLGSTHRSYEANYFCATYAIMYLLGCRSYGSYYDLSCWNEGNLFTDQKFKKKYLEKGRIRLLQ